MNNFIRRLVSRIESSLGYCPRCMRRSFVCAATAWIVFIAVSYLTDLSLVAISVRLFAILSTSLWIAHIVAFSVRRAKNHPHVFTSSKEGVDVRRRLAFTEFAKVALGAAAWTAIPRSAGAQASATGMSCPKDRTATSNLLIAQKAPTEKGTLGIMTASGLNIEQKKVDVKTRYVAQVTYAEAAKQGSSADAFFWVPNSVMSHQDILDRKEPQGGAQIMSCCSNGGCSRCCPRGGCICYDGPNGCFCSSC